MESSGILVKLKDHQGSKKFGNVSILPPILPLYAYRFYF